MESKLGVTCVASQTALELVVMASPFTEAITQSMIAGLDPMNGVVKQYAGQQVERAAVELVNDKLVLMQKLQQLIDNAKDAGSDGNVIAAYQRMLDSITG